MGKKINAHVFAIIEVVKSLFQDAAMPEKSRGMKAYMKNQFEFLGITSVQRRSIYKHVSYDIKKLTATEFWLWCDLLWELPEREYQYLAMDMINQRKGKLVFSDLKYLEKYILKKSWWDTVDALATDAAGAILSKATENQILEITEKWFESNNLWLQRTAILFQLKYKTNTNDELLFDLIERTQDSKEFFIRKAAGWALRQYARTNPHAVLNFVESHPRLSGLTRREALKHL